ncbi:hypothetical protein AUQ43_18475 [Thalassospira sp. MCCC 1A01148]|uniref:Uncharacterized protein n=2 Tax=Thalassospiraceae TaxID=2844866 RepID=A0A367V9C2_9PROT|nr:hypothetical protein AUQ43_18475 [Thalassospira sp. MCCC 1A01148]RCK21091.1 hypothetical protein TH6_15120 [Thalassospira profundimaris]
MPCDHKGCKRAGTHIMVNHGRWCRTHIPPEFFRYKRIAAGQEQEIEPIGPLPADQRKPKQGKLL